MGNQLVLEEINPFAPLFLCSSQATPSHISVIARVTAPHNMHSSTFHPHFYTVSVVCSQVQLSELNVHFRAEYAFYWSFYQDGSIKYEIKLTGELSTNLLSPGEGPKPKWGTLVADRVNAQYHQHMFCARLDMAVDDEEGGKGLQVSEVRSKARYYPY